MRICHIVPSLEAAHGGPSKSVRALCGALARAGHTVDLLTTAPEGAREDECVGNLRIRTFRRDFPRQLKPSSGLNRALGSSDADVVHHHALWLRTLHYAHRSAARRGVPLVISPRGMMSSWALNHHAWRKQAARMLVHPGAFEGARGWHATSAEEEQDIHRVIPGGRTVVAPNGVNEPALADVEAARSHWLHVCPDAATRPVALFYGRFHQKKRVLELIDLWLDTAQPDWLLLMVGLPEQYSPSQLEQYVQRRSAAGRVRVYDGTGVPPPYAVSNLFLLPSHTENFGLTVAEAMAHGVPALVTDSTPWGALNSDRRGWCVPWTEFGDALRAALFEGPDSLLARGARARPWVLREYSWDAAARTLTEFYTTLLRESHA